MLQRQSVVHRLADELARRRQHLDGDGLVDELGVAREEVRHVPDHQPFCFGDRVIVGLKPKPQGHHSMLFEAKIDVRVDRSGADDTGAALFAQGFRQLGQTLRDQSPAEVLFGDEHPALAAGLEAGDRLDETLSVKISQSVLHDPHADASSIGRQADIVWAPRCVRIKQLVHLQ